MSSTDLSLIVIHQGGLRRIHQPYTTNFVTLSLGPGRLTIAGKTSYNRPWSMIKFFGNSFKEFVRNPPLSDSKMLANLPDARCTSLLHPMPMRAHASTEEHSFIQCLTKSSIVINFG